jgi:hypothetical protein
MNNKFICIAIVNLQHNHDMLFSSHQFIWKFYSYDIPFHIQQFWRKLMNVCDIDLRVQHWWIIGIATSYIDNSHFVHNVICAYRETT